MADHDHTFHTPDYVVFGLAIAVSLSIGMYYALTGGKQRTTSEYFVGGRSMKVLPVAMSLVVSFQSSIMMLGCPAESYIYGIQFIISYFGSLTANILAVFIVVPLLHPLKITSAYEYLQGRFNSPYVRLLGTLLGILNITWYNGIVLLGPSIALEAVMGFSRWTSISVIALAAVLYTSLGGLKAVIWTDVFQAIIMYSGMLAVLIKGTLDTGGVSKVWEVAEEGGRLNFFNFDLDPRTRHTFWNLYICYVFQGFGLVYDQSTIQRIGSTKTLKEASRIFMISGPVYFLTLTLASVEGIIAYAYYQTIECDPMSSNKISNPNQIILLTLMDLFRSLPGMPGLFLASVFCASLSTLSSGLSSLSVQMWVDLIKPRIKEVSEFKATVIAKLSVVIFGIIGIGFAVLVSLMKGPFTQITISLMSATRGSMVGLFLLGSFFSSVNAKGALVGASLSFVFSSWISMGMSFSKSVKQESWLPPASTAMCMSNQSHPVFNSTVSSLEKTGYYGFSNSSSHNYDDVHGVDILYTLSYMWLCPVGVLLTIVVGVVVSLVTGGNKNEPVDPRYLFTCDRLLCCLPQSVKRKLGCTSTEDNSALKGQDEPLRNFSLDGNREEEAGSRHRHV